MEKIAELSKMVTKRERLLREQGELIERLKRAETSVQVETAKPSFDADSVELTANQGFRSGDGVTVSRVITVEEEAGSEIVSEVFIPTPDPIPGIEAFDGILQQ